MIYINGLLSKADMKIKLVDVIEFLVNYWIQNSVINMLPKSCINEFLKSSF
jgi:hypothetical protein